MNVGLSKNIENYWLSKDKYFSIKSIDKFIKYFFPDNINININNQDNQDNQFIIQDIQLSKDKNIDLNKIHILLCVENCNAHSHYIHYNEFKNYNDSRIKIYLYNHIDKIEETKTYISIPIIYNQIDYFINNYNLIKPIEIVPFNKKKFCIVLTTNNCRNYEKNKIINFLSNIGECDTIDKYKTYIHNQSCYHSDIFLYLIQNYKFAFVCENSVSDGYITEKIFNCFFGRCIPIYNGSNKIEYYFNKESFINMNDINNIESRKDQIVELMTYENKYNEKINKEKINLTYDNENYKERFKNFIDKINPKYLEKLI
jgi:hypothetical protein